MLKLFVCVAAVGLLSGCVGGAVESKFDDADRHYGKKFTGGVEETKTVTIAPGTSSLRVAAAWDISGGATFQLKDPAGRVVESEELGGTAEASERTWYETSTPTPGEWRLQISVGGTGAYSFGFYY